jgi:uncharacterized protein YbjT (DUF2867 family)
VVGVVPYHPPPITYHLLSVPSVALLGATGLVGSHCLSLLARDQSFERVVVIARRKFAEALAPRLEAHIVDFAHLADHPELFAVDHVICALGTTIKAVGGSQQRFREVDFDIPLTAARLAERQGVRHFLLVSALGANAKSRVFYSRVKGELEDALRPLSFRALTILRPSLLLGDRASPRFGEEVAKRLGWMAPGKYRPVSARDVASVLVQCAKRDEPGMHILESDEIREMAVSG